MPDHRCIGALGSAATVLVVCLLGVAAPVADAALPDGRVYEQVSPPEKNAADVIPNATRVRAAVAGDRVTFASLTGFGDARSTAVSGEYMAVRAPDGSGRWITHGITPVQDYTGWFALGIFESNYLAVSPDLARGVVQSRFALTNAPNVAGAINLYRRDDLQDAGDGSYLLLTSSSIPQPPSNALDGYAEPVFAGASADLSTVYFDSRRVLSADAPPCGSAPEQCPPLLYEWADETVHAVGILPASEGGGVAPSSQAGQVGLAGTAVSQDASRVVFTVPAGVLYQHDDHGTANVGDDTTVRVNASERTDCSGDPFCGGDGVPDLVPDPAGSRAAQYWASSADGTEVFFTTSEQLTDDDTNGSNDVYRADLTAPAGHRLTRLSMDDQPADGLEPNCIGVIGVSTNGSYVYFMTNQNQLVAGGLTGNAGGPAGDDRIFVWHAGVLREVGAVNSGVEADGILGRAGTVRTSRLTPDGTHLAFISEGTNELLSLYGRAEYDHGDACPINTFVQCSEVYIYDPTRGGGDGEVRCASCNPTGARASADASFRGSREGIGASPGTSYLNHPLTDSGQFVFFNTAEQLLPKDHNGAVNAYEYDTMTHRVHLLSAGEGADAATFLDATPDGHDVFFTTRERLRSTDADQSRDLYDARVEGTPDPGVMPVKACDGEDCRPSAHTSPMLPLRGSEVFTGASDQRERSTTPAVFAIERLTGTQRRKLTHLGAASVTVDAARPGAIVLTLAARIGHRSHVIQRLRKTLQHGGSVRFRIRLTKNARKHLVLSHRLALSVTARYSQVPAPQTLHIMLIRPGR